MIKEISKKNENRQQNHQAFTDSAGDRHDPEVGGEKIDGSSNNVRVDCVRDSSYQDYTESSSDLPETQCGISINTPQGRKPSGS